MSVDSARGAAPRAPRARRRGRGRGRTCSPSPAASITSRAARRPPAVTPGATASRPGELRLEADVVARRELVGERAGRERARAVGRVAVDAAPASTTTVSPASTVRSLGRACGFAPFGAEATIVAKAGAVGAELVEELVQPPRELALGAADEALLGEALVGLARDRAARRIASSSRSSLTARSARRGRGAARGRGRRRSASPSSA